MSEFNIQEYMSNGVANVIKSAVKATLKSKLFMTLQEEGLLNEDHAGGCILFEKRAQVEKLIQ